MSAWLQRIAAIEALEDAPLDAGLVNDIERAHGRGEPREIRFSTPTFKSYSSCEVGGCGKNAFPAFSITAGACGLDCDHCQAKILEPMIAATSPAMLDAKVREMVESRTCAASSFPADRIAATRSPTSATCG